MTPPASIHIIEDDADLVEILTENLSNSGYSVTHDRDGTQGLERVLASPPDMLLLDLMLPGMQGLDVCRAMRASRKTANVPVMIISSRGEEADVVSGLELGADDYMTKPFGVREMVARVRALQRRMSRGMEKGSQLCFEELSIDTLGHEVTVHGIPINLTATQFRLLQTLAEHDGRVFTRDQLINLAIGDDVYVDTHNIDVHISSIRQALGTARRFIRTKWGVGYRFDGSGGDA
ncbi:MAG: response regulator transcription factor [Planctomycetales bacterium]|nr:MAG: response regulator transcription factor [Planctomycetales bacterium]